MNINDRLSVHYGIKANPFEYKEVYDSKRTVDLIANTYLWYDMDGDVLMPGCCKKSIEERGPKSIQSGKIKHLKGHNLSDMIGIPSSITEETHEGKQVLRANSYFPESEDCENELIKYKSGMYDQHSIGFRYLDVKLAIDVAMGGDEDQQKLWDEIIGLLINPEKAIERGYMFIVKEIGLYEYSTVAFGSNRLTPYIGSKSENKMVRYDNIMKKLDVVLKSDFDKYSLDIETRQLKQLLKEIMTEEPLIKPEVKLPGRFGTQKVDVDKFIKSINFKL